MHFVASKSTVGPKGQITIPKEMRERYHLLQGEEVLLVAQQEGVLVKHNPSTLRGRLRDKIALEGIEREVRKLRNEWRLEEKI